MIDNVKIVKNELENMHNLEMVFDSVQVVKNYVRLSTT